MGEGVAVVCARCSATFRPARDPWRWRYCSVACRVMARHDLQVASERRNRATDRAWAARNRPRRLVLEQRWRARRREHVRDYERRRGLKRYGVTPEWFRDQLVGQAGRCAICANVFASTRDTHIDHDHSDERVRALLCSRCNTMLGLAHESIRVLNTAIRYLSAR